MSKLHLVSSCLGALSLSLSLGCRRLAGLGLRSRSLNSLGRRSLGGLRLGCRGFGGALGRLLELGVHLGAHVAQLLRGMWCVCHIHACLRINTPACPHRNVYGVLFLHTRRGYALYAQTHTDRDTEAGTLPSGVRTACIRVA